MKLQELSKKVEKMSIRVLPLPTGRIALYKTATSPTRKHTIKGERYLE